MISQQLKDQKSWPFQEAYKLLQRLETLQGKEGVPLVFETGYGPSGLPHIGTFGEVVRTVMVQRAFQAICDHPTRLICFSDDLDGMRKVPSNIPNPEKLEPFLHLPLTKVPDPFGTHDSFAHHNNQRLRDFLDQFGFDYEFMSSSQCYHSGVFDQALLKVLDHAQEIMEVILPTLGEERQKTYSPFFPISPKTGRVLQTKIHEYRPEKGTIIFTDEDGALTELPVTGGNCKLQWKVDWGMRWYALGVDYEIYGKDLFIGSASLSKAVCQILGGAPPEGLFYELFLDEEGKKISKSKGNGLSTEDWLTYGCQESLAYYMYHAPGRAKTLGFHSIPKATDDLIAFIKKYPTQSPQEQRDNPAWHVFQGDVPREDLPVSFNLLLNLASVCGSQDDRLLWKFLGRYLKKKELTQEEIQRLRQDNPFLDKLCSYAIAYYKGFVEPNKHYSLPSPQEKTILEEIRATLANFAKDKAILEDRDLDKKIQESLYEIGKKYFAKEDLRLFFGRLYEILLGQKEGARMGSFIHFYGLSETEDLIHRALQRRDS